MLLFNEFGLLNPGDYEMTFDELRNSLLVRGPQDGSIPEWDSKHRLWLVNNAEILTHQLWTVSDKLGNGIIGDVFLDGSFVTDKPRPNDIDGYFEFDLTAIPPSVLARELNLVSPEKIWTWNQTERVPHPNGKPQLPMWIKYQVELFPHHALIQTGIPHNGKNTTFAEAFRLSRDARPKGIIKLKRS